MSYSYETNKDSPSFTPASRVLNDYGMARVIEGATAHHWGDPNQNPQFDNVVNYLTRSGGNTSAHYVATGADANGNRRVACIVSPSDAAWHSGTAWGNARTIGIELDPRARDVDYDVAAELLADIRSAYGDVPLYWHSYFVATACPGAWDMERLDQLSYTKYSADEWGQGGTKAEYLPAPVVTVPVVETPVVTPVPEPVIEVPVIVPNIPVEPATPEQQTPSPTSDVPDTGVPVADKPDYETYVNSKLTVFIKKLIDFIISLFKRK